MDRKAVFDTDVDDLGFDLIWDTAVNAYREIRADGV